MKIHEYQAKQILSNYGVPTPRGRVAKSPGEVRDIARELGGRVVVKAQVHVGGRGKAGGIKVAETADQAQEVARQILGMNLKGLIVRKVLVEEAVNIVQEFYLGITIDRSGQRNVVMVSSVGGVDIEQVAAETPDKIAKVHVEPDIGLADYRIRQVCFDAGLPKATISTASKFLRALYKAYIAVDASLAEINPLALTAEGTLIAADAKILIDDNALFRHPELQEYKEESDEEPLEAEAHRRGLQYVKLDGDVGVIGNGAGLVMGTLDEVKRAGGSAANFLDIGGGAKAETVRNAIEMVLLNPAVKGVLINVFGGITRCDEVAQGIIEATSTMDIKVPIVVRLTGTNEAEGRALLAKTTLKPVETMQEAASRIVAMSHEP